MTISRRRFLEVTSSAAAFADKLFGIPQLRAESVGGGKPSSELIGLADVALSEAKKLGATYADICINRYHSQAVGLRSVPDIATGKVNHIPSVGESQSFGFGVRVIANGTWGFAASPIVTKDEIARVAAQAGGSGQGQLRGAKNACPISAHQDLRG